MMTEFDKLPETARIWIYQSEKAFDSKDIESIGKTLKDFCQNWQAHGQPLKASYQILHEHFIVLGVDENYNQASGCSIDASVAIIKKLENYLDTDLTNNSNVFYKKEEEVKCLDFRNIKSAIEQGEILPQTIVFNNHVHNKKEFDVNWQAEAGKTWMSRYFQVNA